MAKHYTLEEARELLPRVVQVLREIQAVAEKLHSMAVTIETARRGALGDGNLIEDPLAQQGEDPRKELEARFRNGLAQLEGWGIELKDALRGLIDFRHEREGRVVYLCYELGEEGITHWHELDAGFAGRQPL